MNKTVTLEEFKKLLKRTKNLYISDKQWFIQNFKEKGLLLFLELRGYGISFLESDNENIEYYTQTDKFGQHTVFKLKSKYDGILDVVLSIPVLLDA